MRFFFILPFLFCLATQTQPKRKSSNVKKSSTFGLSPKNIAIKKKRTRIVLTEEGDFSSYHFPPVKTKYSIVRFKSHKRKFPAFKFYSRKQGYVSFMGKPKYQIISIESKSLSNALDYLYVTRILTGYFSFSSNLLHRETARSIIQSWP